MLQSKIRIAILGGGASGLVTSIIIKDKLKELADVTIVERLERVGKKILATGGGKANISNLKINKTINEYNHNEFVSSFFKKYNEKNTMKWFEEIGLVSTNLSEGRVYPKSESANSVLDCLRLKMKDLGINEICNFEVKRITQNNNVFQIESTRMTKIEADYCVIAFGGKSSPMLGSNGTGYEILKKLKIDVTPIYPGLTGLVADEIHLKGLDGIRQKADVYLFVKKMKDPYYKEFGEIQFKSNALSGIVMMNISSIISRLLVTKEYSVSHIMIDLMPNLDINELKTKLYKRSVNLNNYSNVNFLIGMFPKMIILNILKRARISIDGNVKDLTNKEMDRISENIKNWVIPYKDVDSFEHSQVSVGGISLNEVNENLELVKYKNMYAVGEILDIDGLCGGFNLQWAWTSAQVAAYDIINKIKGKR